MLISSLPWRNKDVNKRMCQGPAGTTKGITKNEVESFTILCYNQKNVKKYGSSMPFLANELPG